MISEGKFFGMVAQVDFGNVAVAITTLCAIAVALFTNRVSITHQSELERQRETTSRTERVLDDLAEIFFLSRGDSKAHSECIRLASKLQFRLNGTGVEAESLRDALQDLMFEMSDSGIGRAKAQSNLTKAAREWAAARGYNLSTEKEGT